MPSPLHFFTQALNIGLPHHCPLCEQRSTHYFCQHCCTELKINRQRCWQCALPMHNGNAKLCGQCLHSAGDITQSLAPFAYDTKFAQCIFEYKTKGKLRAGRQLGQYLLEDIYRCRAQAGVQHIVAVPSHWRTRLQRGFDPANDIARFLGTKLELPLLKPLHKITATPTQKTLDRRARLSNLRQAFATRRIRQELGHVALVDDVVTTTATVTVCAKRLKQMGASRVDVWALARTPSPSGAY